MILAKRLLELAQANGWDMAVDGGGSADDYVGPHAGAAWQAVCDVDSALVRFYADNRTKFLGSAFLMVPGPGSCADDESIVDCSSIGPVAQICDMLEQEVEDAD